MVVEIKKRKLGFILITLFIILISGSIGIYFGTKEVSIKTQQDTIYIDKNGKQIITGEVDLSYIDIKKIVQIGFYKNIEGEIQIVNFPRTVEIVPYKLPSEITSLSGFLERNNLFNQDISNWDTSNVTNMNFTLSKALSFEQDISKWNVNKVLNHNEFAFQTKIYKTNKMPNFK